MHNAIREKEVHLEPQETACLRTSEGPKAAPHKTKQVGALHAVPHHGATEISRAGWPDTTGICVFPGGALHGVPLPERDFRLLYNFRRPHPDPLGFAGLALLDEGVAQEVGDFVVVLNNIEKAA